MEKVIEILKTDNNFPELREIEIGSVINVSLTEDKFNELYEEIKFISVDSEKEKSDFYKITFAGINFNINKK